MAVGIIAEYNPFHAGHAHQIAAVKKFCGAEVVAVMSGHFTQRGAPTILDKHTRASLADVAERARFCTRRHKTA